MAAATRRACTPCCSNEHRRVGRSSSITPAELIMSLLRRSFWRNSGIALRRSGQDKRSRAFVFKLALLLILVVAYAAYITWVIASQGAFSIVFLVPGLAGGLALRWLRK